MKVGIERWPGRRWICHHSQGSIQGKHLVVGPVQINWIRGLRIYVTWPVPVVLYAIPR